MTTALRSEIVSAFERVSADNLGGMRIGAIIVCLLLAGCSDDERGVAGGNGGTAGGGAGGDGGSSGGGAPGSGGSSGLAGSAAGGGPPTIARVAETFDVPSLAESAPKRFVDVVHQGVHDVYLVVTGSSAISATFVSGDGQILGSPVSLAQTNAWAQGPRVALGGGKFLVAWHDNRTDPGLPELHGRIVGWSGTGPELGANDFLISPPPTRAEAPPGIAWSDTSQLFLVVWQHTPTTDLRARRVDPNGLLVGEEIALTNDLDWHSDPAVAWNPTNDEFLVVWAHAGASAEIRARRISAADGSLLGQETELGSGTHIPAVAYEPGQNVFLAAWWAGTSMAVGVSAAGEPDGAPFNLAPGYGAYDGLAFARHSALGTSAAVFHGPSDENFAAAFTAAGQQSGVIEATDSPDGIGNFNPRIAENPLRNEWMLVTSRAFATLSAQRLGP
jgi:hypothetical protein